MNFKVDLSGKTALVTGGSSGIGRVISTFLAESGATVAVHYFQTAAGAHETVNLITQRGGKAFMVQGDVAVKADVDRLTEEIGAKFNGRLDILINNAGDLIERRALAEMSELLWNRVIDVNLKSVFLLLQAALPLLKAENSLKRVVNISSVAGQDGGGLGAGAYAAAKAGVIALTKAQAKEFAPFGLRVNAIAPGLIATRYHERYSTAQSRLAMLTRIPLNREGVAEDVAGAVLFLVSDAADYITGHTINVNGGMFLP